MMRKPKWMIGGLLLLPALALLAFGLLMTRSQATSKATLSFGGVTITPIPPQQRNRHNPFSPDTLVAIKINIAPSLLGGHLFPQSSFNKIRVNNEHVSDARGVKYFKTIPPNRLGPQGKINFISAQAGGDAITYNYQLHLAQYPKSVGKLTFQATYKSDNGFKLPVSVVVRK